MGKTSQTLALGNAHTKQVPEQDRNKPLPSFQLMLDKPPNDTRHPEVACSTHGQIVFRIKQHQIRKEKWNKIALQTIRIESIDFALLKEQSFHPHRQIPNRVLQPSIEKAIWLHCGPCTKLDPEIQFFFTLKFFHRLASRVNFRKFLTEVGKQKVTYTRDFEHFFMNLIVWVISESGSGGS